MGHFQDLFGLDSSHYLRKRTEIEIGLARFAQGQFLEVRQIGGGQEFRPVKALHFEGEAAQVRERCDLVLVLDVKEAMDFQVCTEGR
jgi:hypothetical protein